MPPTRVKIHTAKCTQRYDCSTTAQCNETEGNQPLTLFHIKPLCTLSWSFCLSLLRLHRKLPDSLSLSLTPPWPPAALLVSPSCVFFLSNTRKAMGSISSQRLTVPYPRAMYCLHRNFFSSSTHSCIFLPLKHPQGNGKRSISVLASTSSAFSWHILSTQTFLLLINSSMHFLPL